MHLPSFCFIATSYKCILLFTLILHDKVYEVSSLQTLHIFFVYQMEVHCRLDHSFLHPHMECHISAVLPPQIQQVHKAKHLALHMKKMVLQMVLQ